MMKNFDGIGTWVAFTQSLKDPKLEAEEMALCGVGWVAVRCNGVAEFERLAKPFSESGLAVYAWHYSYPGQHAREAELIGNYAKSFYISGHIIDAEIEWENTRDAKWRKEQAVEFGKAVRGTVGDDYHVGHAPLAWYPYHYPFFPHAEFAGFCDSVHPQAYWTELKNGKYNAEFETACIGQWMNNPAPVADYAGKLFLPIGVSYGNDSKYAKKAPGKFSATDLETFLDMVSDAGIPKPTTGAGCSLYSWEAAEPAATNYLKMRKAHLDYQVSLAERGKHLREET